MNMLNAKFAQWWIILIKKQGDNGMNDLNAAFAWVNKLATVQKPEEVSTREAENEEASA